MRIDEGDDTEDTSEKNAEALRPKMRRDLEREVAVSGEVDCFGKLLRNPTR